MNCKPGDLAMVIRGIWTPELAGRFVTVVRLAVPGEVIDAVVYSQSGPGWVVESSAGGLPVRIRSGPDAGKLLFKRQRVIRDELLRPIRDNDGEDETLAWAGKPQQVAA